MGKAYEIGGTMFVGGFLGLILSGALFILADGSWKAPIENSPLKFLDGIARPLLYASIATTVIGFIITKLDTSEPSRPESSSA